MHNGYPPANPSPDAEVPVTACFFPLYPLVGGIVYRAVGGAVPPMAVLLAISNVAAMIGFGFFYSWARDLTGSRRVAFWAVLVGATFPGAVFLSAALTEGPFLLVTAVALWALQRNRLVTAVVATACASALRPTGVAIVVTFAVWLWLKNSHLALGRRLVITALAGVLSASGLIAFQAYLWHRYDRPDAYLAAQKTWEGPEGTMRVRPPLSDWRWYAERFTRPQVWNRGMALVLLVATLAGLFSRRWRGPVPWVTFLIPAIIFVIGWGPGLGLRSSSLIRFEVAALPCFLLISLWLLTPRFRAALYAVCAVGFIIQLYYAHLFSRGVWVG